MSETMVTLQKTASLYAVMAWLLLVPPPGSDARTPLKQWIKMGVYETRDSCELEIKLHHSGAHSMFPNRGELAKSEAHEHASVESAECVPEDDPRLK